MSRKLKILISGGGTGGHVFPAIAIANAIVGLDPTVEILFVGALGRIEMEKVPAAGYKIIGLPIAGFLRRLTLKNFVVLFKLFKSIYLSKKIIKTFKPDIAIGVGGYASGPVVRMAGKKGVVVYLQEQNSYAGVTNKLLAKYAQKIFVAYDGMGKYFPKHKIYLAGNPVRQEIVEMSAAKEEGCDYLKVGKDKPTVLILGGSGGARTLNESVIEQISLIKNSDIQVICQSGKYYYEQVKSAVQNSGSKNIFVYDFIPEMHKAYAAADVIVSRAGAGTISELCVVGKPVILVPSPNVAEDHQTKNAMALVNKDAALLVKDKDAVQKLIPTTIELLNNKIKQTELAIKIKQLELKNAANEIAKEILINLIKPNESGRK